MSGQADAGRDHNVFDARDRETLERAVETWGLNAQGNMAVEEAAEAISDLAEFIVVFQHRKRGRASDADLVDELADVRIMTEQLRLFFGPEAVDRRVQEKMDRLRERLQESGGGQP